MQVLQILRQVCHKSGKPGTSSKTIMKTYGSFWKVRKSRNFCVTLNYKKVIITFGSFMSSLNIFCFHLACLFSTVQLYLYITVCFSPFKRQSHKMAKHSNNSSANCRRIICVFGHFVKFALKGLNWCYCSVNCILTR